MAPMRRTFALGVAIFCTMAFLYFYFGIARNFFFLLWWWDIFMHLIGGILAGLIGAWWAMFFHLRPRLLHCILGALFLGAGVEVVEYYFDLLRSPFMSYPLDVAKDMIVDAIGAALAYLAIQRI